MTQCLVCGGPTKTRREKHYRYTECGLPNVIIDDAVKVTTCERCGEKYTSIPAIEYSVDVLAQVAADDGPSTPIRVELEKGPKGWRFRRGPAMVPA